jgi:dephospho-CoA kinase
METQDMVVIGLTGGIGSGKSVVATRMRRAGVPVIDADQVAREVVQPGSTALVEIGQTFGEHLIGEDGELRRKALGAIVFADPEQLSLLNGITHPAILSRTQEKMTALKSQGHQWVVYEAALILENKLTPGLHELIAVLCDPALQLQRVMARDELGEEAASARIAAQTTNERRRAQADHVLENHGALQVLHDQVDALIERLSQAHGAPLSDSGQDLV